MSAKAAMAAVLLAGCGNSLSAAGLPSEAGPFTDTGTLGSTAGDAGLADADESDVVAAPTDAFDGTSPSVDVLGSRLCNGPFLGFSACNPDVPNATSVCEGTDGAAYTDDARVSDAGVACRVTAADAAPTCSMAGPGAEGSVCTLATDCAAAQECVVDSADGGRCRHYCCGGNPQCAADQFCTIQGLVLNPAMRVPVCRVRQACALLDQNRDAGSCPALQTCAVVRDETGATSCVSVGNARAGESCETDGCAAGLVCLGAWGNRRCYALCHTVSASECSSGQGCRGGLPMFPDPAIGVCE